MTNKPVMDRFMEKVDTAGVGGCWIWIPPPAPSYGQFYYDGKREQAHRVSFELFVRRLSRGEILHHKCENKRCVNPEHLQATNHREHLAELSPTQLAYKAKLRTHCPKGHPLSEPNLVKRLLPSRHCLICVRRYAREWALRFRTRDREMANTKAREWKRKQGPEGRARHAANMRAWNANRREQKLASQTNAEAPVAIASEELKEMEKGLVKPEAP